MSEKYGPQLPPHLQKKKDEKQQQKPIYQPALPPTFNQDDSSDDDFGPLPPSKEDIINIEKLDSLNKIIEIETRAQPKQSNHQPQDDTVEKRGEWMLIPPEIKNDLPEGVEMKSRGFNLKTKTLVKDQSHWTDTPEERLKKLTSSSGKREFDQEPLTKKSKGDAYMKQLNKTRGPSLLETHAETYLKQEKHITDDPSKRRFDRDKDLGTYKTNSKTKYEMIRNSGKGLSDRFG